MRWENHQLFKGLSQKSLEHIHALMKEEHFERDDFLMKEGENRNDLFFLIQGRVEFLKKDLAHQKEHRINIVKSGDIIGEMVLFDEHPWNFSVRAQTAVKVMKLNMDELIRSIPEVAAHLIQNGGRFLTLRLKSMNERTVSSLKKEHVRKLKLDALGKVVIISTASLIFYQLMMGLLFTWNVKLHETFYRIPIIFIFLIGIALFVYKNIQHLGFSTAIYGLTLHRWKKALIEGVLYTIPFLILFSGIKWVMLHTQEDHSLFQGESKSPLITALVSLIYVLSVPLQEFLFRGALQGSLQRFFVGPYRNLLAIFIANLLFVAVHQVISPVFAIVVMLPGFFWGWLYYRHHNLVGAIASHSLIGFWTIFYLGMRW